MEHVVDAPPLAVNESSIQRHDAMASKKLVSDLGLQQRGDFAPEVLLELLDDLTARLQRACAVEVVHVQLDDYTVQRLEEAGALDAPGHALVGEQVRGVVNPTLPCSASAWKLIPQSPHNVVREVCFDLLGDPLWRRPDVDFLGLVRMVEGAGAIHDEARVAVLQRVEVDNSDGCA